MISERTNLKHRNENILNLIRSIVGDRAANGLSFEAHIEYSHGRYNQGFHKPTRTGFVQVSLNSG